jgi:NitT/TauT family transport system permease protein
LVVGELFGGVLPMMPNSVTLQRLLPATVMFGGFIALWQLAVAGLGIREYLLPSPLSVVKAMGPGTIPWSKHISITAVEIVGAFAIAGLAGVLLGAAIAWSHATSRALTPFLVFVNTLPKVAIAPLFLIWLGYGILPNMLIGALIGFFPVVINTAVGLTQIEQDLLDLGRVFAAPKWKVFAKIRVPNAYPYILSALKVTATSAVVGAVVGEFVASQAGLGYVIITTQSSMNTPVAFAALAWISCLGLLLYGIVSAMSRILAPWSDNPDA